MIKAYWHNNDQSEAQFLQPNFFSPKSQLWLEAELPCVEFPIKINITALCNNATVFTKTYLIEGPENDFTFEVFASSKTILLKDIVPTLENRPGKLQVEICTAQNTLTESIACEYATISGKITNFSGKPFPAAVIFGKHSFEGIESGMGVWSDMDGNYAITLPKGEYNSIFVDDESYAKTSLEAWCWKMLIDQDETHDFKIGNAEVYSLNVCANNGGPGTLFVAFRPMALSYCLNPTTYDAKVNDKNYSVVNTCPDIDISEILVTINGRWASNVSLQKIIETGLDGTAMPLYILQIERLVGAGKQTLVLEYDFVDTNGERIQSQGITQFYYTNPYGLAVR